MHKRHAGFSALDAFLVIIILTLIGFGWYVFQAKKKAEESGKKTATAEVKPKADEKPRPSIPSDWIWFDSKDLGFAFAYPKTWSITTAAPETCPFGIKLYGSAACALTIKLSPKEYTEDRRNSPDSSLLSGVVYEGVQVVAEETALAYELDQAAAAQATVERQETSAIDTQKAFYIRSSTAGYTDNLWAVRFPGYYVRFTSRERNTTYYSDGKVSYTTDYARYMPTIERIVKTITSL